MIEWRGKVIPFAAACEIQGLRYGLVMGRIFQGWSLEKALTEPVKAVPKRGKYGKRKKQDRPLN